VLFVFFHFVSRFPLTWLMLYARFAPLPFSFSMTCTPSAVWRNCFQQSMSHPRVYDGNCGEDVATCRCNLAERNRNWCMRCCFCDYRKIVRALLQVIHCMDNKYNTYREISIIWIFICNVATWHFRAAVYQVVGTNLASASTIVL
jgi:hypothetical protein